MLQTTYTITELFENNGWEFVSVDGDENAKSVTKTLTEERYTDAAKTKVNPKWNNSHTFTNRFTELVVKKVVIGDQNTEFSFKAVATLSGFEPGEQVSYGYIDEADNHAFKTITIGSDGGATILFDAFTLKGKENEEDYVLVLPREDGNHKVSIKITEADSRGYVATWQLDSASGNPLVSRRNVNPDGSTGDIPMNADRKVVTFTNTSIIGTAKLKAVKYLDGRAYQADDDQFTFMLTGEHNAPMPVKYDKKDDTAAAKEFLPDNVTRNAELTDDAVRAEVQFGILKYSIADLEEVQLAYSKATEAQKAAVTRWTKGEDSWAAGDTGIPADAIGIVHEKTFTYKVMENPLDNSSTGDTQPITNDEAIGEIRVYVLWNPNSNGGKGAILISGEDASLRYDAENDLFVDNKDQSGDFRAMVDLENVFFTNLYKSTATWTPEAIKVLIGRPLERDQFKFMLKGVASEASDGWVKTNPPMPEGTTEGKEAQNNLQDVEVATADPKGTNNVKGPVSWKDITFTNEWLKKEIQRNDENITDAIKAKVLTWEWKDGDKTYVYGAIPAEAIANIDGTEVTYAAATDTQRKAAKGASLETLWQYGGKYYIEPGTYLKTVTDNTDPVNPVTTTTETDNEELIPDNAKGTYYETERELTYKMWEDASSPKEGYAYDSHQSKDTAYIIKIKIQEKQTAP